MQLYTFLSSRFSFVRYTILLLAVVVVGGCTGGSQMSAVELEENTQLAQCLTDSGFSMYGADSCQFCLEQKTVFGIQAFEAIDYVECDKQPTACEVANIQAFPTWIGPGYNVTGVRTLTELAQASGCSYDSEVDATVTDTQA